MKVRSQLTAGEIEPLYAYLSEKLADVGVPTQPEVACRVLDLSAKPDAGLREFAEVIKADASLSGRLLRVANSAMFAQRGTVTKIDRACVLLGLERLKALSLGFYLGQSAGRKGVISRRVWGESVYRACLAGELARAVLPSRVPQAFVVGLMLDAGTPVLVDILGDSAQALVESREPPMRAFRAEFDTLPFTHVDIVAAMARRWKLPASLSKPIEFHHTMPPDGLRDESARMQAIAFYVGAVALSESIPPGATRPLSGLADRLLRLPPSRLEVIVKSANDEYAVIRHLFRDFADSLGSLQALSDRVHRQLVASVDDVLVASLSDELSTSSQRFEVGNSSIEIEQSEGGMLVAFLVGRSGERLTSCEFEPGAGTLETLMRSLGVEPAAEDDTSELRAFLTRLAA